MIYFLQMAVFAFICLLCLNLYNVYTFTLCNYPISLSDTDQELQLMVTSYTITEKKGVIRIWQAEMPFLFITVVKIAQLS